MSQIFHRSTNTFSRILIFGADLLWPSWAGLARCWTVRHTARVPRRSASSPCRSATLTTWARLGIDCRYCHTTVETSGFANVPPTKTCMNCHSQIWKTSPTLEPVRASYRDDKSISWTRVHDLPDFVYFNHSIHVKKAWAAKPATGASIRCRSCAKANPLQMEWCLDCHRNTEKYIRPRSEITTMGYDPDGRSGRRWAGGCKKNTTSKMFGR